MKKKLVSSMLAAGVLFNSSAVLAEIGDHYLKTNLEKPKFTELEVARDLKNSQVTIASDYDNYAMEGRDGKIYSMADVDKAFAAVNKDHSKLLDELEKEEYIPLNQDEEDLVVKSVSAITETYVALEIAEVKEDQEDVTIEVKDSEGKVREVKPVSLIKGDKTVEFEFVKAVDKKDLKGVWTVAGIKHNIDEVKNLEIFKTTDNQIAFDKALKDLEIENVKAANIPTYMGKAREDFLKKLAEDKKDLTVEAVQEFIDATNKKIEEEGTEAEANEKAAKAVVDAYEAGNDILLTEALGNEAFERVNKDWLSQYKTEFNKDTEINKDTKVEEIQAKIDAANLVELNNVKVAEVVDREELNKAKELVDTYAKKDKEGKIEDTEIAKIPEAIEIQLAIVDVRESSTPTRLKPALERLAKLDKGIKMDDYKEENAKFYINGIAKDEILKGQPNQAVQGIKAADVKKVDDIATVITNVNEAVEGAETALEERISTVSVSVVNKDHDGKTSGKTKLLGYSTAITLKETNKISDAKSVVVELLKDKKVLGTMELRDPSKHEVATISGTLDVYGDYVSTSWKHEWLGEMTDKPTDVKVTVTFEDGEAVKEEKVTLNNDAMQPFYLVLANRAETAEDMSDVLLKLAEIGNNDYLNVPKADRLYVAEQVLEARNAVEDTKKFAKYTDLTGALDNIVGTEGTYTNALAEVNKLNEDSPIADVIEALSFDKDFAKMSIVEQSDIAEAFFNSLFEDGEFVAPNFRTLAAVKAAAGL